MFNCEALNAMPDPAGASSVTINLKRASYLDSYALGKLVQYRRRFVEAGGDPLGIVLLLPKNGPARRVFEITGLVKLFGIVEAPAEN